MELPKSGVYNHLIVAIDGATKYIVLKQATGETARAACNLLMEIVRRCGRPQRVVSDRGTAFTSKAFQTTCELQGIKFKPIETGRPRANGMVERENKTILDALSIMCNGIGKEWAKYVGEVEYALNTRVSSVTGHSPYELVFGRLPPGPVYIDTLRNWEERTKGKENLDIIKKRIILLQQEAYENQKRAADIQQRNHDQHAQRHVFKVGDKVMHRKKNRDEQGVIGKLNWNWRGPYTIKEVINPVTYKLQDEDGDEMEGTAHSQDLLKIEEPVEM